MRNKSFQLLIDHGLVREAFVQRATGHTLTSLQVFLDRYTPTTQRVQTVGMALIKTRLLTPDLVETTIVANKPRTRPRTGTQKNITRSKKNARLGDRLVAAVHADFSVDDQRKAPWPADNH
jgi:hypothetical protein